MRLYVTGDPAERKGYGEIELGPTHAITVRSGRSRGVPLGVHELKIIEVHEWLSASAENRRPDRDFEEGWHACEVLEAVERSAAARQCVKVWTPKTLPTT